MGYYEELVYLRHYFKHTEYVVMAWKKIRDFLYDNEFINDEEFEKINTLIIWHDNSKIDKDEWKTYACKFGSKEPLTEEEKEAFNDAVKKHKEKNLHHYESLKNYTGSDWKCYIIELVCDYIAMGWEFDNYIFEYYEGVKRKMNLPPLYKEYLEQVLIALRDPSMSCIEEPLSEEQIAFLF